MKRIQSVPLVIGQFLEMVDANYGIVGSTAGSNYYVRILRYVKALLIKMLQLDINYISRTGSAVLLIVSS